MKRYFTFVIVTVPGVVSPLPPCMLFQTFPRKFRKWSGINLYETKLPRYLLDQIYCLFWGFNPDHWPGWLVHQHHYAVSQKIWRPITLHTNDSVCQEIPFNCTHAYPVWFLFHTNQKKVMLQRYWPDLHVMCSEVHYVKVGLFDDVFPCWIDQFGFWWSQTLKKVFTTFQDCLKRKQLSELLCNLYLSIIHFSIFPHHEYYYFILAPHEA